MESETSVSVCDREVRPLEEGIGEVTKLLENLSGIFFKKGADVSGLEKGSHLLREGLTRDVYTV